MKSTLKIALILLVSLVVKPVQAQMYEAPVSLQVNVLKKIFVADKIIKTKADSFVLIVHDSKTADKAGIVAKMFNSVGIKTQMTLKVTDFNGDNINAIYYLTDSVNRPDFIKNEKILTISGNSEQVSNGLSAIALKVDNGSPIVVINKALIQSEGHSDLIAMIPKAQVL